MKSRKLRMLLLPVLSTLLVISATPSSAAVAAGSGEVAGSVTTNPGVPLDPTAPAPNCGPNPVAGKPFVTVPPANGTFSFNTTAITGSIVATENGNPQNTATFDGTVNVTAAGTACDTAAFGVGRVTGLTGTGTTSAGGVTTQIGVALNNTYNGSTMSSNPPNVFVRNGGTVEVWLKLNFTIRTTTSTPATSRTVTGTLCVKVTAQFVPTTTNGTHVTGAAFTGTWTAVGGVSPLCNKKL